MMRRLAVSAALIAMAGCAGVESMGRNAQRTEMPPPPEAAAATQMPAPAPPAAAPSTPPPAAAPPAAATPAQDASAQDAEADESEGAIVVPGQREMQVPPPSGDPRSVAERMEDVRAWDQCVTATQSAFERDPMRPQLDSPEEYCSRTLGMADRTAVPASRRR